MKVSRKVIFILYIKVQKRAPNSAAYKLPYKDDATKTVDPMACSRSIDWHPKCKLKVRAQRMSNI